jgi:fructokinase
VKRSPYFVYGSLAARNTTSRKTLLSFLENTSYKVFDINLRPPFFEKDTLNTLLAKADMLKTNREELQVLWEMFGNDLATEADQVEFIKAKFNIKEIIITHGAKGAVYYAQNNIFHCKGIPVEVCDTIGSGDAFLAAFIAGHFHKENPEIILEKAVAMGSFIATKKGGCPPYELSEYLDFFNKPHT